MDMPLLQWMIQPLRKYATFSGRARRKEYWAFMLFTFVVGLLAGGVDVADKGLDAMVRGGIGLTSGLVSVILLLPSLAVSVRRLHDLDRSGWWLLLLVVPVIGTLVLLIWYCSRGTHGANRYGPDPLPVPA